MTGRDIVAVDIGGTHARFAIATIVGGCVTGMRDEHRFKCADDPGFAASWARYAATIGRPLPAAAAIAVAGPVDSDTIRLVNNPWVLHRRQLPGDLGIDRLHLINDFAAVGHAVAQAQPERFRRICGPDAELPTTGAISIIGPGTGLGVAMLLRTPDAYQVIPSEGGHTSFAVRDADDEVLAADLRRRFGRASAERVVSGPGLRHVFAAMANGDESDREVPDDAMIWQRAIEGHDALHAAVLGRFCASLGAFAGDMALAHGAGAVVLAGSLANRLFGKEPMTQFAAGFTDKGRFAAAMEQMLVLLLTEPEPGLFGAAASFAALPG